MSIKENCVSVYWCRILLMKPIEMACKWIRLLYFLIYTLILSFLHPLHSTCQTFHLARELDYLNGQMRELRQQYEQLTRDYQIKCQAIERRKEQLNKCKDQILKRLASIDQWPVIKDEKKGPEFSATKTDSERSLKNVDTKRLAKWFDRQFSCGAPSIPLVPLGSLGPNTKDSLLICPTNKAIRKSKPEQKTKLFDLETNFKSKWKSRQTRIDMDIDQMVNLALRDFRQENVNYALRGCILELYQDPEWKPLIDQLRIEYKLFSYI